MSADNYIGVFQIGDRWGVDMGFASDPRENPFPDYSGPWYATLEAALVAAHDAYRREAVVEYGVIELGVLS